MNLCVLNFHNAFANCANTAIEGLRGQGVKVPENLFRDIYGFEVPYLSYVKSWLKQILNTLPWPLETCLFVKYSSAPNF